MTIRHRCFPVNLVKLLRTSFLHLRTTQNKFCTWQFMSVFPFILILSVHDARKHWNKWKPGDEVGHKFNIWFPECDAIIPSVVFHKEASQLICNLICTAAQMTGFYMKFNTGWNGITGFYMIITLLLNGLILSRIDLWKQIIDIGHVSAF